MSRRSDDNKDVLSKIHESDRQGSEQRQHPDRIVSSGQAQAEADFAEREGCSCPPVLQRACNRALRVARL